MTTPTAPYFPKADIESDEQVRLRSVATCNALSDGLDLNRLLFARFTLPQRREEEFDGRVVTA